MSVWRLETSEDPVATATDGKGGHGLKLAIHCSWANIFKF